MNKKSLKVLIIVLSLPFYCVGQDQTKIDSMILLLNDSISIQHKIKLLDELAWQLKYNEPLSAMNYAKQGLAISTGEYEFKKVGLLNTLGIIARQINNIEEAKGYYKNSLIISKKYEKKNTSAATYINAGILYKNLSIYDSAIYFYELAKKSVSFSEDSIRALNIRNNIAINVATLYSETNRKILALEEYKKVEKLCLEFNDIRHLAIIYANTANIYNDIKDYENAMIYHKKSLHHELLIGNTKGASESYSSIGGIFNEMGKKDSALFFINKSIELGKQVINLEQLSHSYYWLGEIHMKYKDYEKSKFNFETSLDYAKQINNIYQITYCLENIAEVNLYLKNMNNIMPHLNEALEYFKVREIPEIRENVYENFMNYYFMMGDVNNARKYSSLLDSLTLQNFNIEKRESLFDLETKYETEKKEKEILALSNENNQQAAALANSRLINFSVFGTLLVLLISGLFFWNRQRQNQKLAILQHGIETSEIEKNRIGKELHDGIAGSLIKLVYDSESIDVGLSHKLLNTYNEVRDLSHQLNQTPDHSTSLFDKLSELMPENSNDKNYHLTVNPPSFELAEPHLSHFYRIVQELIANEIRHANANNVQLSANLDGSKMVFNYRDDGTGMEEVKPRGGLRNIQDRVSLMKGDISMNTSKEEGFSLTIEVDNIS